MIGPAEMVYITGTRNNYDKN